MLYTLCWYDPTIAQSCELPYGTLADAQLHLNYLYSIGMTNSTIKCEVLN